MDISQAWGDGTAVAADGTRMGTCLDSLLAETSVRYGVCGGPAARLPGPHTVSGRRCAFRGGCRGEG
ncbi:Tn3 family transposase [Streptomyces roseoverticillatus]|uniref:Tn3 family transposase n=1 Tax=Streptomyces roseoverticillatus TaxID=66429 RepID=A0ABV3ISP1_9ACTN